MVDSCIDHMCSSDVSIFNVELGNQNGYVYRWMDAEAGVIVPILKKNDCGANSKTWVKLDCIYFIKRNCIIYILQTDFHAYLIICYVSLLEIYQMIKLLCGPMKGLSFVLGS
jgi:hypothetical protein